MFKASGDVFRDLSNMTEESLRSKAVITPELTDPGPDEVVVCARKAFRAFRRRQQWKALVLFIIYFFPYLVYINLIIDWSHGGGTIQLYRVARSLSPGINSELDPWCDKSTLKSDHTGQDCWWFYKYMQTVDDLENYLRFRLDKFPGLLREVCPSCKVAISTDRDKIQNVPLHTYTCSDLNRDMEDRDCSEADAEWAKKPTLQDLPCCSYNSSLVAASLTLRAWYNGGNAQTDAGEENVTLEILLDSANQEAAQVFAKEYITNHINTNGHFFQVLVFNGFGRAAGIHYTANWAYDDGEVWSQRSKEQMWSHRIVKTNKSYWSRRWDFTGLEIFLLVWCWVASGLSFLHSMTEAWSICHSKAQWVEWFCSVRTWLIFLTVSFPVVAITGFESAVHPVAWVVLVVVTELIMLARFMLEGEVIPACRILIRTLFAAVEQLATLSAVLMIIIIVIATLYGQLFGVFMFTSYEDAFFAVLDQFGNGAKLHELSERYNPFGSKLMYFVTMFILFLTLSQVFITVLMDSFESARELSREADFLDKAPENYVHVGREFTYWQQALDIGVSGLTYWLPLHGTTQPQLIRALKQAIEDLEEAYPELKDQTLGVSQKHLSKCLSEIGAGSKALDALVAQFGAARHAEPAQTSKSNLATPQTSGAPARVEQIVESKLDVLKLELMEAIRGAQLAPVREGDKARVVV